MDECAEGDVVRVPGCVNTRQAAEQLLQHIGNKLLAN
jgi:hypothetical protein